MATVLDVDPSVYSTAATKCHEHGMAVTTAFNTLLWALNQSGKGMAGDYDSVKTWCNSYDKAVGEFVNAVGAYVNGVLKFSDALRVAGYNHALAEWVNRGKQGSPPDTPKLSNDSDMFDSNIPIPTAFGSNGNGLGTDIDGLLSAIRKLNVQVPNGDINELGKVADALNAFAKNDAVANAATTMSTIGAQFDQLQAPELSLVGDYFTDLKDGASAIADTAGSLGSTVSTHKGNLSTLRNGINRAVTDLEIGIGLAVGMEMISIAAGFFTFGAATAAGTALTGAALVSACDRAAVAVRDAIAISDLIKLLQAAAATIEALRSVQNVKALVAIGALTLAMATAGDSDDSAPDDSTANDQGVKLTKGGKRKIGNLTDMKDMTAADAIRARGGGAGQVRQLENGYENLTVGELANRAATGDAEAETAIKIIKQANAKAQKYGNK